MMHHSTGVAPRIEDHNRYAALQGGQAIPNGCNVPSIPVSDGEEATTPNVQLAAIPGGRTVGGQFAKGNSCGRGNPFARRLGALRKAFLDAVSDTDVAEVAQTLRDLALAGDVAAAQVFLAYALGKPARVVEPDRLDLDEFALLDAAPTKARVVAVVLTGTDPAAAAMVARSLIANDDVGTAEAVLSATQTSLDLDRLLDEVKTREGKPT